jgi:hypothetical protein
MNSSLLSAAPWLHPYSALHNPLAALGPVVHRYVVIPSHMLRPLDAGKLKHPEDIVYPIRNITENYNKGTDRYNFVTKLENSSWNVLCVLLSEVANIGTGHILP